MYRDILVFELFPFMAAKYSFDCVLHQDNDAKRIITDISKVIEIVLQRDGGWLSRFIMNLKINKN